MFSSLQIALRQMRAAILHLSTSRPLWTDYYNNCGATIRGAALTSLPGSRGRQTPHSAPSRGGFESDCHSRPISRRKTAVHRFPRNSHGGGTGRNGVAPPVVLIDRFRPALALSVKCVGVEELPLPDESRTCVPVPDHFFEDNLVRFRRSDSEGHGQIASY
jgi:hypothetical protein